LSALRLPLALLLGLLSLALPTAGAGARVIGVLFDDSGSMAQNIQLPTYGIQTLVATLDGRNGQDRLITVRLSDFMRAFDIVSTPDPAGGGSTRVPQLPVPLQEVGPDSIRKIIAAAREPLVDRWAIADQAQLKASIDKIAHDWPSNRSHTPYVPIEVMLQTLVDEIQPGEEGYFVIATDGAFYDGAQLLPADVAANVRRYAERLKGKLTVFFLLTLNAPDTERMVEQQGVRRALLQTFGGKAYNVRSFAELQEAMLEIVASVSATDPAIGSAAVRVNGTQINLNLPFTVTRIISISQGEAEATLPSLAGTPFPVGRRIDLSPEMLAADNQLTSPARIEGWPTTRLKARVTQIEPAPPLAPGRYQLTYNAAVGNAVRLLFRSDVFLDVEVKGPNGEPVPSDRDGRLELTTDTPYQLHIRVIERVGGREQEVELARLPDETVAFVGLQSPQGDRDGEARRDASLGRFVFPLVLDKEGEMKVRAGLRVPGLLTTKTVDVVLKAEKRDVDFSIAVERAQPCPDCAENAVAFSYSPSTSHTAVATLTITAEGRPGTLLARLDGENEGFALLAPSGHPLAPNEPVAFAPGQPVRLTLAYVPGWRPAVRGERYLPHTLTVAVTAAAPLRGGASRPVLLSPRPRNVRLQYAGEPAGPQVSLVDLAQGTQALEFVLDGALPEEGAFETRMRLPLTRVRMSVTPDGLIAAPTLPAFWRWFGCDCWQGLLFAGERKLDATWRSSDGVITASATAPVRVAPAAHELVFGCFWFALVVLCMVWLGGLILALLRASRFPGGSRLMVSEPGYDLPHSEKLRGPFLRHFGRCALWFLPGSGIDEWRRLEGLTWIATPSGALLKPMRHWPAFRVQDLGQSIEEIARQRGAGEPIEVSWGGVLQELAAPGRRLELVEDHRRRA